MRHRELTLDEVIKVAINSVDAGIIGKAEAEQMILGVAHKKLTLITAGLVRNNQVLGEIVCNTAKIPDMQKIFISEKVKAASFNSKWSDTIEKRFSAVESMAELNNEMLASII